MLAVVYYVQGSLARFGAVSQDMRAA